MKLAKRSSEGKCMYKKIPERQVDTQRFWIVNQAVRAATNTLGLKQTVQVQWVRRTDSPEEADFRLTRAVKAFYVHEGGYQIYVRADYSGNRYELLATVFHEVRHCWQLITGNGLERPLEEGEEPQQVVNELYREWDAEKFATRMMSIFAKVATSELKGDYEPDEGMKAETAIINHM